MIRRGGRFGSLEGFWNGRMAIEKCENRLGVRGVGKWQSASKRFEIQTDQ